MTTTTSSRFSCRDFNWFGGDRVDIMQDRWNNKFQMIVRSTHEVTGWYDTPELALQAYNDAHKWPKFERPNYIWPDWFTGIGKEIEEY